MELCRLSCNLELFFSTGIISVLFFLNKKKKEVLIITESIKRGKRNVPDFAFFKNCPLVLCTCWGVTVSVLPRCGSGKIASGQKFSPAASESS